MPTGLFLLLTVRVLEKTITSHKKNIIKSKYCRYQKLDGGDLVAAKVRFYAKHVESSSSEKPKMKEKAIDTS